MSKQIICDKCNEVLKEDNRDLFECFDGSLQLDGADLCQKCWDELQNVINKFTQQSEVGE